MWCPNFIIHPFIRVNDVFSKTEQILFIKSIFLWSLLEHEIDFQGFKLQLSEFILSFFPFFLFEQVSFFPPLDLRRPSRFGCQALASAHGKIPNLVFTYESLLNVVKLLLTYISTSKVTVLVRF